VTFPNIWKGLSIGIAGDLAEYLGVRRECEARDLAGLLELRTVKLYVGYGLSYVFRKNFPRTKLFAFDVLKIFGVGLWTILQTWGDEAQMDERWF
jgi:hypothetical protein